MPTPEQDQAIEFGDGHLQLIACAGSGKTETITRRVVYLVEHDVPPESIVAFTFTNRAADEMATRIRSLLSASDSGGDASAGLRVGTIHSYCHQRLTQAVPRYLTFDMLDNDDMRPLFCYRYFNELGLDRLCALCRRRTKNGGLRDPSRYEIIHDFCHNADLVRDERIDPEELVDPFRQCYLAYLDLLDQHHYLDFAGIIARYVGALEEDSELRAREQARVRYLIVDEYQDVNTLQEALIRLMIGEHGSLCVVGDDDQCIYHWRGSDIKNLRELSDRYPGVTRIGIERNFRSTPGIIAAAETVISRNAGRLEKTMEPWEEGRGRTETGDIAACFFAREGDELEAVIQQMRLLHGRPYMNNRGKRSVLGFTDMGILMRSVRRRALPLLDALSRAGIDYTINGGRLFDKPEVTVVMQAFAFLGGYPYPRWSPDPQLDGVPVTLPRLVASYANLPWAGTDPDAFRSAMAALRRETAYARDLRLQRLFHQALQAMGADRAPFPEAWYYNLGRLSQLVTAFEHVYPQIGSEQLLLFLDYVVDHAMDRAEEGGADERLPRDAVTVSTIHRAKGLQFPVVFMPRLNAGEFPLEWEDGTRWLVPDGLFDRARYEGGLDDERRVFYVGLTRSEKYLYLSGHCSGDGGPQPEQRSVFFDEFPGNDDVARRFPVMPTATEEGEEDATPPAKPPVETTWSELRYYAGCPFGYRLRFVHGFDPIPKEDIGIGRAVHNVLAAVHQRALNGALDAGDIPAMVDENMVLRFAAPETKDRVRRFIERNTRRYVEERRGDLGRIAGIEKPFSMAVSGGLVNGQVDLVLDAGDGGIEIRDFKLTERGATENRQEAERQLHVYALAAATLGREVSEASIHAFDTGATLEVPVGPDVLAEARGELERMIAGIGRQEFPPAPDEKRCAGCDWGLICCGKSQG